MEKLAQIPITTSFGSRFTGAAGGQISDVISLIVRVSFAVSGLLILFLSAIAGFYIIMGAGSDNPEQAAKGKRAATTAAIGFAIVFCAYWIIRFIEISFKGGNFITDPGSLL